MRTITTHKVGGVDERLRIEVSDEPGAGGACHRYRIVEDTKPGEETTLPAYVIKFQQGPIKESGLNGMTQEVLLAIVKDRLESFQKGDHACELNEVALGHVNEALAALQQRTRDRIERNVEGTSGE